MYGQTIPDSLGYSLRGSEAAALRFGQCIGAGLIFGRAYVRQVSALPATKCGHGG